MWARGRTVIDYIIKDQEVWERIERMKVESRVNSDHFPVVVEIKERVEKGRRRRNKI